jgi:hypothetical protein
MFSISQPSALSTGSTGSTGSTRASTRTRSTSSSSVSTSSGSTRTTTSSSTRTRKTTTTGSADESTERPVFTLRVYIVLFGPSRSQLNVDRISRVLAALLGLSPDDIVVRLVPQTRRADSSLLEVHSDTNQSIIGHNQLATPL